MAAHGAAGLLRDARGRLVAEHDRHGQRTASLTWSADALQRAAVLTPAGSWLSVEPRAGAPGPWGASDLLVHEGVPVTRCAAVDWAAIRFIPPVAEPERLPPGGGTALLNVIARLALDQQAPPLVYDAPYPTESLFLSLLESFVFETADPTAADPLAAFVGGALAWRPRPHDRAFEGNGVVVQRRQRIEKIVVDGRVYHRPDWQGVRRRTPRVVRDDADTVRASLVALGVVLEDHLVLDRDGTVRERPQPPADPPAVRAMHPDVVRGVIALVVATSAAPLGRWIRAVAAGTALEWGPVDADLAAAAPGRVRVSPRLLRALRAAIAAAAGPARTAAVLAALHQLSDLAADPLRRQAQAALAAASADEQAAALAMDAPEASADDAAALRAAVTALPADAQLE